MSNTEDLDLDVGKSLPITKCYECGSSGEDQDGWWSKLVEYQGELLWARVCDVCHAKPNCICVDCKWVGNKISECAIRPHTDPNDPMIIGVSACPKCGGEVKEFGD